MKVDVMPKRRSRNKKVLEARQKMSDDCVQFRRFAKTCGHTIKQQKEQ